MAWDEDAIVAAAVARLVAILDDGPQDEEPVSFRPELVVRESTAPPA